MPQEVKFRALAATMADGAQLAHGRLEDQRGEAGAVRFPYCHCGSHYCHCCSLTATELYSVVPVLPPTAPPPLPPQLTPQESIL